MCVKKWIDPIDPTLAILIIVLNVFGTPLGTFVYAFMSKRYHISFLVGICQVILILLIVPAIGAWIWGIVWGVMIYKKSVKHQKKE